MTVDWGGLQFLSEDLFMNGKLRILGLFGSLLGMGCGSLGYAEPTSSQAIAEMPQELVAAIESRYDASGKIGRGDIVEWPFIETDLNKDGDNDYIVEMQGGFCGSDGCAIHMFESIDGRMKEHDNGFELLALLGDVEVLDLVTNGYRDIRITSMTYEETLSRTFQYDTDEYVLTETIAYPQSASLRRVDRRKIRANAPAQPPLGSLPVGVQVERKLQAGYRMGKLGNYRGAVKRYSKALELDQVHEDALTVRGLTWIKLGRVKDAILDINNLVEHHPSTENIRLRADLLARNGYPGRAVRDYRVLIKMRPNDADAYSNLAATFAKKGDFQSAIESISKAISINSNDTTYHYNRAVFREKVGNRSGAIQDLSVCESLAGVSSLRPGESIVVGSIEFKCGLLKSELSSFISGRK